MAKRLENRVFEFEGFRLDAASWMLYHDEVEVLLPPKAVETLLALVERSGEIIPKDDLMSIIWPDSIVEESNLSQNFHLLRKILGKTRNGKPFIETLKRRGYRFNGDVAESRLAPQLRDAAVNNNNGVAALDRNAASHSTSMDEPHGSVVSRLDLKAGEDHAGLPGEISRENVLDQHPDRPSKSFIRPRFVIAAGAAAVLTAVIPFVWFIWFKSATDAKPAPADGDMVIVNLTSGEEVNTAAMSPDGYYFVYSSGEDAKAHLWLQQTGQASRREIIQPFEGNIYGTTFSPDSQFVYFVSDSSTGGPKNLYRVPALGGVATEILTDILSTVSFSPDGSEMAFARKDNHTGESSLVVSANDGTAERAILTTAVEKGFAAAPAWSPDGRMIAYGLIDRPAQDGACTINAVDPNSKSVRALSAEKWDVCYRMAWTRDGKGLVFLGTKFRQSLTPQRDQIFYLTIRDGKSRRITTDDSRHEPTSLTVTDADEILAIPFNRLSQIWAMNSDGDSRTAVQITRGFADGRSGIAPISDGRVAYLTRHGRGFSIWIMNPDGSGREQLTTDPSEIEELRADLNGRFLVFSGKIRDGIHLFRMDLSGKNLSQLTFGEGQEIDSTVSNDGDRIAYETNRFDGKEWKSNILEMPSSGGEARRLTEERCLTPHYSPDGKFLSCVLQGSSNIAIIDTGSGALLKTIQTEPNPTLNSGSRWTPDGTALTYIIKNNNIGNIWRQDLEGGTPQPLTTFTSGEIYNYAFSTDGSHLYIARGYSTRNVVVIKSFR